MTPDIRNNSSERAAVAGRPIECGTDARHRLRDSPRRSAVAAARESGRTCEETRHRRVSSMCRSIQAALLLLLLVLGRRRLLLVGQPLLVLGVGEVDDVHPGVRHLVDRAIAVA